MARHIPDLSEKNAVRYLFLCATASEDALVSKRISTSSVLFYFLFLMHSKILFDSPDSSCCLCLSVSLYVPIYLFNCLSVYFPPSISFSLCVTLSLAVSPSLYRTPSLSISISLTLLFFLLYFYFTLFLFLSFLPYISIGPIVHFNFYIYGLTGSLTTNLITVAGSSLH